MAWRFLKQSGMTRASEVVDDFTAAVAAFDPEVASQAQVELMATELRKLDKRLAETEAEVEREQRETAGLQRTYDEYLQAAHLLEAKLQASDEPAAKSEVEPSLARIVAKLELLNPEIARAAREDCEIDSWRMGIRGSFEDLSKKLRLTQRDQVPAPEPVQRTRSGRDRADQRDRRARVAASMTSSISALSVALDSMNQQAASLRAEAEALQLRAGLFHAEQLESDPQISAALDRVRGTEGKGARALSARLAALANRTGRLQLSAAE